jgi:hypothetical protein
MSEFQIKPGYGYIFRNQYRDNPKSPEFQGKLNIDGEEREISLWVKEDKNGKKFFSAKLKEAEKVKPMIEEDDTDDLPF